MKILVLSDSHLELRLMRRCIDTVKPRAVIHLGDYYDDCKELVCEYPQIYFYQVPGNCDQYCNIMDAPEKKVAKVCGVRVFMTHGHLHHVKRGLDELLLEARKMQVQAALFGHTHSPLCQQTDDGIWVLNPGSCASENGSAGLISVEDGQITDCRILRQPDLETFA